MSWLNWLFRALCNGKNNGLAFLLLNYPVFNLIAPKGFIPLKKVFRMSAADHPNFSSILLKKKLVFAFGAIKLKNNDIQRQTTETTF